MREQVVAFPPQPVITQDNVTISIDTVFYFTVTDPFRATYEVANLLVGDRAAHGDDAAQRDRLALARGGAHLARQDQRRPPHRARRGDRALGPARQPDRAQVDRPARLDPGGDGEADAGRARQARRDPHRRGRQAVADPRPPRARSRPRSWPRVRRRRRSSRRGRQGGGDPARAGRGRGDAPGLPGDPRRQPVADLLTYQYIQNLPRLADGQVDEADADPLGRRRRDGRRRGARRRASRPAARRRRTPAPPSSRRTARWLPSSGS